MSVNVATLAQSADVAIARFARDLERLDEKLLGADIGMIWSVTAFAQGNIISCSDAEALPPKTVCLHKVALEFAVCMIGGR